MDGVGGRGAKKVESRWWWFDASSNLDESGELELELELELGLDSADESEACETDVRSDGDVYEIMFVVEIRATGAEMAVFDTEMRRCRSPADDEGVFRPPPTAGFFFESVRPIAILFVRIVDFKSLRKKKSIKKQTTGIARRRLCPADRQLVVIYR